MVFRAVRCCIVCHDRSHTYKQALNTTVGLGLILCVCFCVFFLTCAILFELGLIFCVSVCFAFCVLYFYLPHDVMHSAHYTVERCPSVRLSVFLSHAGIRSKRLNMSTLFSTTVG